MVCLGRHTVTGLLSTCGLQFSDWSAAYRLFARERVHPDALFRVARREAIQLLPPADPRVCLALDDTLLHKTGTHIHGVAYRRDPLGPKFQTNLVRAQRFIQFSLAVPDLEHPGLARMVPIDFHHAPTPAKPRRNATAEEHAAYSLARKQTNLVSVAVSRLAQISADMPDRSLLLLIDGGYTNRTMLRGLPANVEAVGRIRKDAQLYWPAPAVRSPRGRTRRYGELAPTPEQLQKDDRIPWQTVRVFAAGRDHDFRVKTLDGLLWRSAGYTRLLRLVVIAPLAYRPCKNSRVLYRQPAFLISTDRSLDLATLVQRYVWRWEIEVNHREEKSLLGVGQAQVRGPISTDTVPAFIAACYAMLLLAALRLARSHRLPDLLPPPRWRRKSRLRPSTQQLINLLRSELWARALGLPNFSGFANIESDAPTTLQSPRALTSAVLYAVA